MAKLEAIGLVEMTSIALAYKVEDAMLKAADVSLLVARTICPGKYIIIVGGEVSSVRASVAAGVDTADESLVEERVIPNVHEAVFPAISLSVLLDQDGIEALGVVETFSAASCIEAADAAAKSANVTIFRIHLAMAIGGKGFILMTGDVAAVEAAVAAAAQVAADDGVLVAKAVIPGPRPELFNEFV